MYAGKVKRQNESIGTGRAAPTREARMAQSVRKDFAECRANLSHPLMAKIERKWRLVASIIDADFEFDR